MNASLVGSKIDVDELNYCFVFQTPLHKASRLTSHTWNLTSSEVTYPSYIRSDHVARLQTEEKRLVVEE